MLDIQTFFRILDITAKLKLYNLGDKMKTITIESQYLQKPKAIVVPEQEQIAVGDCVVFSDANGLHIANVDKLGGKYDETSDLIFERRANDKDISDAEVQNNKQRRALKYCSSLLLKHKLDMNILRVYVNLDASKIMFYYTAENRVDFRDLVKDLANEYHTRIEMRQMNEREEIASVGGIGICGQICCCKRFLSKPAQVSIKMAKNQNLALNPNKINGYCGKLMCCLAYENDEYLNAMKEMPKLGTVINLPDGEKGVVHFNKLLARRVVVDLVGDEAVIKEYDLDELKKHNSSFENSCDCKGRCVQEEENE